MTFRLSVDKPDLITCPFCCATFMRLCQKLFDQSVSKPKVCHLLVSGAIAITCSHHKTIE